MFLKEASPDALAEMEEEIYAAAKTIAGVNPDIIVVGCTSGTLIKGYDYDRKIINKIYHFIGFPAITTSTAVCDALKRLNISKVAVATPYIDSVNEIEKNFLEANGINVIQIKGLGYSIPITDYPLAQNPVSGIGLLDPIVAYRMGLDLDTPEANGIFISCTNFRTIEIIMDLELTTGKPVISSNQASMAMALIKMGIKVKNSKFGSLFELD
jgi:maleate isomerase